MPAPFARREFHLGVNPPNLLRRLRRPLRELWRGFVDQLLPPVCASCGAEADELCEPCRQQLAWRPAIGCARCGEQVAAAGTACGGDHRELQNLVQLVAPWRYAGTGGALVRRFKLDGNMAAGRLMLRAAADAWRASLRVGWGRAVLVPVPLHPRRRRLRGFDQAAWMAENLATRLRQPCGLGCLGRVRATLPQGDPRVRSRSDNVADAFAVRDARSIVGRRVVLVDDVFTSGATLRRCAALLLEAGAKQVAGLTVCRS